LPAATLARQKGGCRALPLSHAEFNYYNLVCDIRMVIDVGLGILQRCSG
jgi:hypothetical protein